MISIEMLPVAHGDALWIEYGSRRQPRRILIDGGPAHSYEMGLRRRIIMLREEKPVFELIVVTHIDADHIDGALILLQDKQEERGVKFKTKEFWFNGWDQLPKLETDTYAPLQGEFLGGLLTRDSELEKVWNKSFDKAAVMVKDDKPLKEIPLEGDARITLLGPTARELRRLRARWNSAIRDFTSGDPFTPGDTNEALRRLKQRREYKPPATPAVFSSPEYGADRTPANGSSISFVLEHDGVRLLLLGDAHASSIATSLSRLAAQELPTQESVRRLHFDAVKLPHHGSMGNVSDEWLKMVDCKHWLISTSGAVFGHPDIATAKLIAKHCPDPIFYCNYLSDTTRLLKKNSRWSVVFPDPDKKSSKQVGLMLELPIKA